MVMSIKAAFEGTKDPTLEKVAVFLRDENTIETELATVAKMCLKNGFEVKVLDCTQQNIYKAAELVSLGQREHSVCYIAGAGEGDDPELIDAVKVLAKKVASAGFNTVYPGSAKGQMGVLAKAVLEEGAPVTSVFSLDVAQAHVEELCWDVSSIVVAPNEKVRQTLYHLLSGAQIALPGGTGTKTEASIHYYQNTKMGLVYRKPEFFGPENYASPILYFSPKTQMVQDAYKKALCEKLYADDKDMQKMIMSRPLDAGYWDFESMMYDTIVERGFENEAYMAFVQSFSKPEEMIEQLICWGEPCVRDQMTFLVNEHYAASRASLSKITQKPPKPDQPS